MYRLTNYRSVWRWFSIDLWMRCREPCLPGTHCLILTLFSFFFKEQNEWMVLTDYHVALRQTTYMAFLRQCCNYVLCSHSHSCGQTDANHYLTNIQIISNTVSGRREWISNIIITAAKKQHINKFTNCSTFTNNSAVYESFPDIAIYTSIITSDINKTTCSKTKAQTFETRLLHLSRQNQRSQLSTFEQHC